MVASTSKPSDLHSATARVLVSTTALNCIARKSSSRARSRTCSPSARPTPRPEWLGSTMKLALEMCAAPPPWLRTLLAVPRRVPPASTATKVRPGGSGNHICLAWDSVVSRSHENVSPARTTPSMNAHIPGQSCGVASLISMAASRGSRHGGRNRVSDRRNQVRPPDYLPPHGHNKQPTDTPKQPQERDNVQGGGRWR